jgi:predicted CoA-binding protein
MANWRDNLISEPAQIKALLERTKTIAVIGIKTEQQADQPAYSVPRYMQGAGFEIFPVPVYYPEVTTILGRPVYRKLIDIPVEIDLVNVFRRPQDVALHLDDMLAKRPKAVWMQLGIRNDAVAQQLAEAGIQVVQDKCIFVEHRHLF